MERTWLVFRLGPCTLCAPALEVEGIIQPPQAITKFPVAPDYALGAFLFRGQTAAAISLRRKLKLRQGEDSMTGPFIVARIRDALVAFWADEVSDVLEEKDADWRPVPAMLAGGFFERLAIRGPQLILQTTFAALLDAKVEFESFAAWAAARAPSAPEAAEPKAPIVAPVSVAPVVAAAPVAAAPVGAVPQVLPLQAKPALAKQFVQPSRAPKAPRRIEVGRSAPTRAPQANPVVPLAPRRSADAQPVAAPVIVESRRKAFPLGYRFAAVGAAVVALAAVLYGGPPAALRDAPPAPVVSAPLPPPQREQVVIVKPDMPKTPDNPVAESLAVPTGTPAARTYVVVRGDTLWDIAKKHAGDASRYPELAKRSSIGNPHRIHPGDVVRIELRRD
jgi:chemotaxis signal transduction protein/LysM repeat protein